MKILLQVCFVGSVLWSLFFLLMALAMGSGLADEPGDTNGLRRFGFVFVRFVLPGAVASTIAYFALRARKRAPGGGRGFPSSPGPAAPAFEIEPRMGPLLPGTTHINRPARTVHCPSRG